MLLVLLNVSLLDWKVGSYTTLTCVHELSLVPGVVSTKYSFPLPVFTFLLTLIANLSTEAAMLNPIFGSEKSNKSFSFVF